MESLSLYINEVATLLLAHETHISRKKALASLLASINLAEAAKPNFSPNSSMQAFSSDSASTNPQAYVSQGQSSLSSNFGSSYNNYNGGNRFFNSVHGGDQNFSRGGGCGRGCYFNVQYHICHKYDLATFCHHRHDDDYVLTQPMDYPNQYPNYSQSLPSPKIPIPLPIRIKIRTLIAIPIRILINLSTTNIISILLSINTTISTNYNQDFKNAFFWAIFFLTKVINAWLQMEEFTSPKM